MSTHTGGRTCTHFSRSFLLLCCRRCCSIGGRLIGRNVAVVRVCLGVGDSEGEQRCSHTFLPIRTHPLFRILCVSARHTEWLFIIAVASGHATLARSRLHPLPRSFPLSRLPFFLCARVCRWGHSRAPARITDEESNVTWREGRGGWRDRSTCTPSRTPVRKQRPTQRKAHRHSSATRKA